MVTFSRSAPWYTGELRRMKTAGRVNSLGDGPYAYAALCLLLHAKIFCLPLQELHSSVSDIVEDILKMHDTTKLGHLTLEDYQIWSVKSAMANEFLNLLFQVCHIVLGLRPGSPEEEGQIIRGWLERESRHGLQQSQNWFLISMLWWQQWKDYVKYVSQFWMTL
ncbi:ubiquitin carboxyl-terminal hydrolase 32-like [Notothenia coriiceps]|uniref:Ubiquitin carboxyl-terminal hydrolase 32-like n=1 Tax=Notothenia coriiceps TaxID=8208 RepID=A0A6I9MUD7_9TELE|nr:PREDICTED: ubiquitin carboxyl-terminal hydrolase 32-like [Notothenia coriiceps]